MFRAAPKLMMPHRSVAAIAVFLTAAMCVGCANDKKVISQANDSHLELQKAIITDPDLANYIQQVGDRIIASAEGLYKTGYRPKTVSKEDNSWMFSKSMKFHFVNSNTLNAFTTGGEHMYVYTRLLQECKDEDELAAVMAHEYGHVFGRHVEKGMDRSTVAAGGSALVGAASYAVVGDEQGKSVSGYGQQLAGMLNARFTRGDESEADHLGFDFYTHSGWDPGQFANFFKTIQEYEKKAGGAGPTMLSDHPATADRIKKSEEWAKEWESKHADWQQRLKPPVADVNQFQQIKARIASVSKTAPSAESLNQQKLLAALPRSCMFPDEPMPADAQKAAGDLGVKPVAAPDPKK